jgi:nucleotidyltransferase/DNA polymerase involved in DNA repair
LAIQQKQIIVTCNYEARRRGLHKLQLIREAKKVCPDVVIVLGEDLTRFRDASKDLYNFLRGSIWSAKAERLGFDEVWYVLHEQAGLWPEGLGKTTRRNSGGSFGGNFGGLICYMLTVLVQVRLH